MKLLILLGAMLGWTAPMAPKNLYSFSMKTIEGKETKLSAYRGKVVLIVNTASHCGYTPQFAGLQALYEKYRARDFTILGFPSNDFGGQDPGTDAEIAGFCKQNYGVTFPMFSKVKVLGPEKVELFQYLSQASGDKGELKWNFEKFLIDRTGAKVLRFRSSMPPDGADLIQGLEVFVSEKPVPTSGK